MSSFAEQYGIRLHREYETISYSEYRRLLTGINGDTALGKVVRIRSETDYKKIREMTKHEKEIRAKWIEFKNRSKTHEDKILQVQNMLRGLFGKVVSK